MQKWTHRDVGAPPTSDGAGRPHDNLPKEASLRGAGWKTATARKLPPHPAEGVPLSSLATGDRARVRAVDVSTPVGRRLLDLGFVPGTEVRVIRRSPLGDPIAFYLRGYQLCLRRSEAVRILVEGVRPVGSR